MASPLTQFANSRILFKAPGGRTTGRDGFKVSEGQAYLIRAFLKRRDTPELLTDRLGAPAVNGLPLEFEGYCISYAPITPAEANTFESIALDGLAFDTSAQLPAELRRDARVRAYIPGLELLDFRFSNRTSKFGTDGIGGIIRGVLGDAIFLEGGQIG